GAQAPQLRGRHAAAIAVVAGRLQPPGAIPAPQRVDADTQGLRGLPETDIFGHLPKYCLGRGDSSAPYRAHRPRRRAEAGFADVVLELLAPYGVADDRLDLVVARAGAKWLAQIRLVDREQTRAQL